MNLMPDTTDVHRPSLSGRALDDLRFIRRTMERAAAFSAIPGWGGVLMGLVAFLAVPVAREVGSAGEWLGVWIVAAACAGGIGSVDIVRKARFHGTSLLRGPGWRFATALLPSFAVGAVLTVVLALEGLHGLLPGLWLVSYGAATLAAGPYTIRPVRVMGLCFMVLGALALATVVAGERSWGDVYMAAGFGGLHVLFGAWIARGESARG